MICSPSVRSINSPRSTSMSALPVARNGLPRSR
ncbi:hypothetical protein A2U01_0109536, partial [Trifolium medium]|nr:hypothetical protein [Trifolium medium]